MKGKSYSRKLSYNDRLFIAADSICPPVINQLFFDGDGYFDVALWEKAVAIASEANPGSRLKLRGFLAGSRWVDTGISPDVIEVDGNAWDGTGPDNAPFLRKKLDPIEGPTCEILLIHGDPLRVCFRTHHAVMDGMGTLTWAEDIFRVLRDEKPNGSSSTLLDQELTRSVRKQYRVPFPKNCIAPTGHVAGVAPGVTWKRIAVPGKFSNITARVALLAARHAWKHQDGPVRFAVPVDLRRHMEQLRSTANLSIAIYIEVNKDSTHQTIADSIRRQLQVNDDCLIDWFDPYISHIPISFLVKQGMKIIRKNHRTGRYGTSGILSTMNRIPMDSFSGGGFNANVFWGIPPSIETVPFFMGISNTDDTTHLMLSMPKVLADNNRLDRVLSEIGNGLSDQ